MVENSAPEDGSGASSWQERPALVVALGVLGVAVVGLGAWFLLFSGSSADEGPVPSAQRPGAVVTPVPTTSTSASPTKAATVPARAADLDLANDPFSDLYPALEADTDASESSAPTETPTGFPTETVSGGPPSPSQTSAPVATSVKITLVAVNEDRFVAKVRIDDGAAQWIEVGSRTVNTVPQITLLDVSGEGYATFYAGDDPDDSVDIKVGKSHKFS